jgi:hypothetical protein
MGGICCTAADKKTFDMAPIAQPKKVLKLPIMNIAKMSDLSYNDLNMDRKFIKSSL